MTRLRTWTSRAWRRTREGVSLTAVQHLRRKLQGIHIMGVNKAKELPFVDSPLHCQAFVKRVIDQMKTIWASSVMSMNSAAVTISPASSIR